MLSNQRSGKTTLTSSKLKAILKIQSIVLKAIHDFFEEQEFIQLFPVNISRLTVKQNNKDVDSEITVKYHGQSLKWLGSMVLHNQLALKNNLDRVYTISSQISLEPKENATTGVHAIEYMQLDVELSHYNLDKILRFIEEMMRRIKIDIEQKAKNELKTLGRKFHEWSGTFPIYTLQDMLIEYGDQWEQASAPEFTTPIWISNVHPMFYDKNAITDKGREFNNFSLLLPEKFGKVLTGSVRENEYKKLIDTMEYLDINRYNYSDYLIKISKSTIPPSAGFSLGIDRLVRYYCGLSSISDLHLYKRTPGDEIGL